MPTLVIDNVPIALYDRIQQLAKTQRRTPADTVLDMLENALRTPTPCVLEAPLPQEPFLTNETSPPFDIPWPKGEVVTPVKIADYLPEPHDSRDGVTNVHRPSVGRSHDPGRHYQ